MFNLWSSKQNVRSSVPLVASSAVAVAVELPSVVEFADLSIGISVTEKIGEIYLGSGS